MARVILHVLEYNTNPSPAAVPMVLPVRVRHTLEHDGIVDGNGVEWSGNGCFGRKGFSLQSIVAAASCSPTAVAWSGGEFCRLLQNSHGSKSEVQCHRQHKGCHALVSALLLTTSLTSSSATSLARVPGSTVGGSAAGSPRHTTAFHNRAEPERSHADLQRSSSSHPPSHSTFPDDAFCSTVNDTSLPRVTPQQDQQHPTRYLHRVSEPPFRPPEHSRQ